uniref:dihydrolipoyllysine-residue succinyltransferase n=1 Tax=Chloropicon laureae TaxID=464258 RepID=A0A7S2Z7B2_9CHLO|mmetsp:Transcript_842/g.2143  ORF Transcript_842/g.2143 Transcript_842/m.2143 type:complete len:463 (+) Transcript_842:103-1491(+)
MTRQSSARKLVGQALRLRLASTKVFQGESRAYASYVQASLSKAGVAAPAASLLKFRHEGALLGDLSAGNSQWRRGFRATPAVLESVTIDVPQMGDSISEGTIATIDKAPGDAVAEDEVIVQVETDKVTIDIRSPGAGVVEEILVAEDDTVVVGQAVAKVNLGAAGTEAAPEPAAAAPEPAPAAAEEEKPAPAAAAPTPAAPKKAAAAPAPKKAPAAAPKPTTTVAPAARGPRERRVPMTRMRKRIAERLKGAQNTYAMLSTFNEIDMTNLMALRKKYKDEFMEEHGVKLGFMSAFVKAAADALQKVPAVNAVIDGDDIIYKDYCDISIAVASPKGLVVPVLRDADRMSFADVEKTIAMLGQKARDGTMSIDDMAGGTFSITNGGVFGSLLSTPIINPPQSAILGMHATNQRPMVVDGQIVARPMMYVTLTYDHRLIDGREAVTFLKRIKEVVEDPARIVLDI